MRGIVTRWLLLTAVCGIGCHTGAAGDPPVGPSFGGPISDFPRSEIGEGTPQTPSEEASEPPDERSVEMGESEAPVDPAESQPAAPSGHATDTDGLGSSGPLDAVTNGASELDAGNEASIDDASVESEAATETDGGTGAEGGEASAGDP